MYIDPLLTDSSQHTHKIPVLQHKRSVIKHRFPYEGHFNIYYVFIKDRGEDEVVLKPTYVYLAVQYLIHIRTK